MVQQVRQFWFRQTKKPKSDSEKRSEQKKKQNKQTKKQTNKKKGKKSCVLLHTSHLSFGPTSKTAFGLALSIACNDFIMSYCPGNKI